MQAERISEDRILALIPARGGSRRIPGKNTVPLCGKPLIAYTLEAARQSKHLDKVVVTTDSATIAKVARHYGAEVPFLRPPEISGASAREIDFYTHALSWLAEHENYEPDLIVTLYPTSPLRRSASIDKAIRKMLEYPEADCLRSVTLCSEHPHKMWQVEGGFLVPFLKGLPQDTPTLAYHQLPEVYIQNASIYITKPETIRRYNSPLGDKVLPFIMQDEESLDINVPEDLHLAEIMLESKAE